MKTSTVSSKCGEGEIATDPYTRSPLCASEKMGMGSNKVTNNRRPQGDQLGNLYTGMRCCLFVAYTKACVAREAHPEEDQTEIPWNGVSVKVVGAPRVPLNGKSTINYPSRETHQGESNESTINDVTNNSPLVYIRSTSENPSGRHFKTFIHVKWYNRTGLHDALQSYQPKKSSSTHCKAQATNPNQWK